MFSTRPHALRERSSGIGEIDFSFATVPSAFCTGSFAFLSDFLYFSFFSPRFATTCQSPSLFGAWLSVTWAYEGDGPPFPLLRIFSCGGVGGCPFLSLRLAFWRISQRRRTRSLEDPHRFCGGVGFQSLLDFYPAFHQTLVSRQRFTQLLTISYVTPIDIHFG